MKSKAIAVFIKNLLDEAKTNLYTSAVMRKYCENKEILPIPFRPPFLSDTLISCIRYVKENVKQLDSTNIYRALLIKEFDLNRDFILRVEERNNNFKENALRVINSKFVSINVRSYLWKFVHNISYLETDVVKIEKTIVKCRLCHEESVEREHILLTCNRLNRVGKALVILKEMC